MIFNFIFSKRVLFALGQIMLFATYSGAQEYTLSDDDVIVVNGEITSCSYSFELTDIIIPEMLDGQTVVGIKTKTLKNAVFYAKGITSVQFPSTIQYIGGYAFCFNQIQTIDFSNCPLLTYIGWYAFTFNETITSVNLSGCSKLEIIDDEAFSANDIKQIDLSDCISLKNIGWQAFLWNGFLTDVNLDGCTSLITIEQWAFSGTSLGSVDLSSCTALVNLGYGAFDETQVSNVVLPTPDYPGFEYWEDTDGNIFYAGDTVCKVNGYNAKDVHTPVTFVVTNDDSPFEGASIDFYNGPYITNELGLVVLANVLQGTYTYIVSAEGFADVQGEVMVDVDSLSITIEMSGVTVGEIPENIVSVYPNPGTKHLNISLPEALIRAKAQLYNNSGQLILEKEFHAGKLNLNTATLPLGIYLYRIVEGDKTIYSGKWVKE